MNAAFTGAAKATANSQSAGSNASVGRRPLNKRKKINGRFEAERERREGEGAAYDNR